MQVFPWTLSSPGRDADFESQIIIHEYAHGLSSRLTGGPANANALETVQAAGMAEGWSDFFVLALLQTSADLKSGSYPMGNYVSGRFRRGLASADSPTASTCRSIR